MMIVRGLKNRTPKFYNLQLTHSKSSSHKKMSSQSSLFMKFFSPNLIKSLMQSLIKNSSLGLQNQDRKSKNKSQKIYPKAHYRILNQTKQLSPSISMNFSVRSVKHNEYKGSDTNVRNAGNTIFAKPVNSHVAMSIIYLRCEFQNNIIIH